MLNKMEAFFSKILNILGVSLFCMLAFMLLSQVLTRYVFKISLAWVEELSRFFLVWLTFIGLALATRNKAHLGVNFFVDMFPPKGQKFLALFVDAVSIFFCWVMVRYGIGLSLSTMLVKSFTLKMPMGYVYGVIPLTGGIAIVFLLFDVIKLMKYKEC